MPVFNPAKPKLRYQLTFEGSWPTSVAFLGSGRRLAAGNQLGHIFVWDLPEKPPEFKAEPKSDGRHRTSGRSAGSTDTRTRSRRLVATPDGKHLASASFDRTVRVWPTDAPAAGQGGGRPRRGHPQARGAAAAARRSRPRPPA